MHAIPSTSSRTSPVAALGSPRRRPAPKAERHPRRIDQRQRHLDHRVEVGDGDVLVGGVDLHHPVRQVQAGQPLRVEDVRVGAAAGQRRHELVAAALERRPRELDDRVGVLEAVALVGLAHLGLERALGRARREGERVEHLLDEVCELARVVRARLGLELAPLRDDVAGAPAVIRPTFAVVSSSIRPRRRSAIAFAAAAIAERPSSGTIPECAGRPWKRTSMDRWYGAPMITSPIGAAWS